VSKELGLYCKAYYLRDMRAFSGWQERADAARPSSESEQGPRKLDDDSIVYLQADLSVTDGIFLREHVIYSNDGGAWKAFCDEVLKFAVPQDVIEAERLVQEDLAALQSA
jgi:hypothetical protein